MFVLISGVVYVQTSLLFDVLNVTRLLLYCKFCIFVFNNVLELYLESIVDDV